MTRVSGRLSEADVELWLEVTRTVVPRPEASVPMRAAGPALPRPPKPKPAAEPPRRPTAASYTPLTPVPGPAKPQGLDRIFRRKLAGGRAAIDGVLDLHGMTQTQAHGALRAFLLRTQARDGRLVLIVTGKGERLRADGSSGVLKRLVPFWLRDPPLRDVVVGFDGAARHHGGDGALYVRLRRRDR